MRQYEDYSIFINVPPPALAQQREKEIKEASAKGDFKRTAWLRNVKKYQDELAIDPAPDALARDYEDQVVKHLNLIRSTPIGQVILNSLNRNEKLWILPLGYEERKADCNNCAAYVFPSPLNEGGGIRLYYSPAAELVNRKWAVTGDDTFVHELTHALRFSWNGSWDKSQWVNGYQDQEEFIATIMENLYRSSKGEKSFYSAYIRPKMMTKEQVYEHYSHDSEVITWFKRCTFSDSFLWAMARRTDPVFNPWRDREQLESRWVQIYRSKGVKKFPGS